MEAVPYHGPGQLVAHIELPPLGVKEGDKRSREDEFLVVINVWLDQCNELLSILGLPHNLEFLILDVANDDVPLVVHDYLVRVVEGSQLVALVTNHAALTFIEVDYKDTVQARI